MLKYNLIRLLSKCIHAVTWLFFFVLSQYTLKNMTRTAFLGLVKNLTFFYKRADFPVIVNISIKTLWRRAIHAILAFFHIFNFFQIVMVSLFLACHDQYLIMFKDLNVFESFQTKYNNTAVFSVSSNYLFSRRKQEKILLKQFFE